MSKDTKVLKPAVFSKVGDLEPDSCGLNLKVVVTDFKTVLDRPKFDGSRTKVGEAIIGDDTGSIVFTARDDQLDLLQPGASLILRNSKVEMYKSHMRLSIDEWGLIEKSSMAHAFEPQLENNLSSVEYELVELK